MLHHPHHPTVFTFLSAHHIPKVNHYIYSLPYLLILLPVFYFILTWRNSKLPSVAEYYWKKCNYADLFHFTYIYILITKIALNAAAKQTNFLNYLFNTLSYSIHSPFSLNYCASITPRWWSQFLFNKQKSDSNLKIIFTSFHCCVPHP